MVRLIAFLIGLLGALTGAGASAAESGAPAIALPPLPETDFPGQSVTRGSSLIGFPDGTAALQVTITPEDEPPYPDRPPEKLWLIGIDGTGRLGHWQRLPKPSAPGAWATLGLRDHSILMFSSDRGYAFLAKIDPKGALAWEEFYGSGTYGGIPAPIALADGFAILEDDWEACVLHRIDERGVERWHLDITDPRGGHTGTMSANPVLIAPLRDGGIAAICNFDNAAMDRRDGWYFNIDPQGKIRRQRPLQATAMDGVALNDSILAVFGYPYVIDEEPHLPRRRNADAMALMLFGATTGRLLRSDANPLPEEVEPGFDSETIALEEGGLLTIYSASYGDGDGQFAMRLDSNHSLLWLRPLAGDDAAIGGTAVLATRQILFAINGSDEAADMGMPLLRVLPLD